MASGAGEKARKDGASEGGPGVGLLPRFDFAVARAQPEMAKLVKEHRVKREVIMSFGDLLALVDPKTSGTRFDFDARTSWLMDSDLHKALEAGWGKADCMVPGKYKRARQFVFETPDILVIAVAETGNRGSGWEAARKADAGAPNPGWMRMGAMEAEWSSEDLAQVASALRQIIWVCSQAHEPTREAFESTERAWLASLQPEPLSMPGSRSKP